MSDVFIRYNIYVSQYTHTALETIKVTTENLKVIFFDKIPLSVYSLLETLRSLVTVVFFPLMIPLQK